MPIHWPDKNNDEQTAIADKLFATLEGKLGMVALDADRTLVYIRRKAAKEPVDDFTVSERIGLDGRIKQAGIVFTHNPDIVPAPPSAPVSPPVESLPPESPPSHPLPVEDVGIAVESPEDLDRVTPPEEVPSPPSPSPSTIPPSVSDAMDEWLNRVAPPPPPPESPPLDTAPASPLVEPPTSPAPSPMVSPATGKPLTSREKEREEPAIVAQPVDDLRRFIAEVERRIGQMERDGLRFQLEMERARAKNEPLSPATASPSPPPVSIYLVDPTKNGAGATESRADVERDGVVAEALSPTPRKGFPNYPKMRSPRLASPRSPGRDVLPPSRQEGRFTALWVGGLVTTLLLLSLGAVDSVFRFDPPFAPEGFLVLAIVPLCVLILGLVFEYRFTLPPRSG